MGYSIRTDAHRYTRWIDWSSRVVLSEEFYDYKSNRRSSRNGPFLVERENRIDPAKVPEAGVQARCTVCSHVVAIARDQEPAPTPAPPVAPETVAPPAAAKPREPARSGEEIAAVQAAVARGETS